MSGHLYPKLHPSYSTCSTTEYDDSVDTSNHETNSHFKPSAPPLSTSSERSLPPTVRRQYEEIEDSDREDSYLGDSDQEDSGTRGNHDIRKESSVVGKTYRRYIAVGIALVVVVIMVIGIIAAITIIGILLSEHSSSKQNIIPNITYCPDDLLRSTPLGGPTSIPVWWVEPSVSHPSDTELSYEANHQPGDSFSIGETNVVYNFTDGDGLLSVCEFLVTVIVIDDSAPNITDCTSNIFEKAPDNDNKLQISWQEPTAQAASGRNVTVFKPDPSHAPGSWFTIGTAAINYVFVDTFGLHDTCSFLVTVQDVTPPSVYQCPDQIDFEVSSPADLKSVLWIEPNAEDNSGKTTLIRQSHSPGSYFPVGFSSVQYVYTDPSGNIAVCSFMISGKVKSHNSGVWSAGKMAPSTIIAVVSMVVLYLCSEC